MRHLIFGLIIGGAVFLSFASAAHAFCSSPQPPSAPQPPGSYDRPRVPDCLKDSALDRGGECDRWELQSYDRDREGYIRKLERFVEDSAGFAEKAERYSREAKSYSDCEMRELRQR